MGPLAGLRRVAVAFVLGLSMFLQLRGLDAETASAELSLWDFIAVGDLQVDFGLLFDPLSGVFVLLITGVGFLIHLYAVGYMAHDEGRRRFFGYFNLFVAAMLLLVLGNNYVMLYFGWEGVGLASYLLISFWYTRPSAATAGKKAFLMNRVGDAGFAIAHLPDVRQARHGQLRRGLQRRRRAVRAAPSLVLGLLLLLGACGKSGQFPLQAWLPDAMEGPTPVSALIHAATMVTAGVYLIARSNPIFSANPTLQTIVVSVGALTLLIGCIIGCAKDDIKRVLAWSTVSQIGYMFLGVGLGGGAYALAIIHLLAHGFFKAGLFLGAGSVMHGMNDQVDIRRFGGLWKYMRITWITFGIGLARHHRHPAAVRLLLQGADHRGRLRARPAGPAGCSAGAALLGAGLTAFYMTRLFVLTFHGPKRWTEDIKHPHESPPMMTVPLMLLAVGSVGRRLPDGHRGARLADPGLRAPGGRSAERGALRTPLITVLSLRGHRARRAASAWRALPQRHRLAGAAGRRRWSRPPAATSTRTPSTRRSSRGRASYLTRALVYFDNKGIDGAGQRPRGRGRRRLRPAAPAADRLRPLLRPVHARRRRAGRRGVPRDRAGVAGDDRLPVSCPC